MKPGTAKRLKGDMKRAFRSTPSRTPLTRPIMLFTDHLLVLTYGNSLQVKPE